MSGEQNTSRNSKNSRNGWSGTNGIASSVIAIIILIIVIVVLIIFAIRFWNKYRKGHKHSHHNHSDSSESDSQSERHIVEKSGEDKNGKKDKDKKKKESVHKIDAREAFKITESSSESLSSFSSSSSSEGQKCPMVPAPLVTVRQVGTNLSISWPPITAASTVPATDPARVDAILYDIFITGTISQTIRDTALTSFILPVPVGAYNIKVRATMYLKILSTDPNSNWDGCSSSSSSSSSDEDRIGHACHGHSFESFTFKITENTCQTNSDCNQSQVCNQSTGTCVDCNVNIDCPVNMFCNQQSHQCVTGCEVDSNCSPGNICSNGLCVPGCTNNNNCALGLVCDTDTSTCVQCITNANCSGNTPLCNPVTHLCGACITNSQCPQGQTCNGGICGAGPSGNIIPSGTILPWAGSLSTAPTGYLLSDGASYPEATYPTLFAVIGTTYGGGGGNFNVPDLRGRVPVGRNENGIFSTAVGNVVGEETHSLLVAEMPAHSHTGATDGPNISLNHAHEFAMSSSNAGGLPGNGSVFSNLGSVNQLGPNADFLITSGSRLGPGLLTDLSHSHTFTTSAAGSGTAHNIVQPSLVVQYIIKI